jgi:hypothetical protein
LHWKDQKEVEGQATKQQTGNVIHWPQRGNKACCLLANGCGVEPGKKSDKAVSQVTQLGDQQNHNHGQKEACRQIPPAEDQAGQENRYGQGNCP